MGTTTRTRRTYAPRMPLEQRKEQLLDAALTLIGRVGYGGVTIEAIAAEAGVTKPVVYGAYAKLPLLLGDLLDHTYADALTQLLATFPDTTPRPAEVTRAWAAAVRGNPRTWVPILLTGAHTPQVVLDRIEDGRQLVRDSLAQLLANGAPITSRDRVASEAIIAAAEHFGRRMLTTPDEVDDDELAELFEDLVRAAARRPQASRTSSSTPSASR
ncbi:MAG TPA: TetR/AcrR family transcriptional regulator [Nocardioides sp.]|nr:TetR/AcrR family transcriptional regulator [Nocardioides sp.]